MVFGANGIIMDIFIPQNAMEKKKTSYAIHPSGDVYFLDYDKEGVYLYRVENVWDRTARNFWYVTNTSVTASNVRLREKPTLDGTQVGLLQTDQRIQILEKTKDKMKVGEMEDYWYKINTVDGQTGWVYGGFLKLDE